MMATGGASGKTISKDCVKNIGTACAICTNTYNNLKLLDCSHTFCESCIHNHFQNLHRYGSLKNGIECPLCRKLTSTAKHDFSRDKWVMSLPANEAVISNLDVAHSGSESLPISETVCQPCEHTGKSREAVFYCSDCNEYQCTVCSECHQRFSALGNHKPVRLKESQTIKLYSRRVRQYDICVNHSRPIEFICVKHNHLCCNICSVIRHSKCKKFKEIKELDIEENKSNLKKLRITTLKAKIKTMSIAKFCRDQETKLANQGDNVVDDIERMKQRMIDMFDKLKLKAEEQTSVVRKKRKEYLQSKTNICMDIEIAHDDMLLTQEAVLNHGSPTQIFITAHKLTKQLKDSERNLKKRLSEIEVSDLSLKFGPIQKILDLDEDLMKLSEATQIIGVEKIPDYRCVRLKLLDTIEIIKFERDELFPFITGMTYLSDGRLIAVDNGMKQYLVFDDKAKLLHKAPLDNYPGGIASLANDTIAIAELNNKTIGLFNITTDNTLQRTSTVSTTVPCSSVSFADKGKYAIGTFRGNKPACLVSENGEVVEFNAEFPARQYSIDDTICEFIPDIGKLVLTVQNDDTVRVYDTYDGTEVVVRDERIQQPVGSAISDNGCIFVCSRLTHCIVQISQLGEVISSYKLDSMEYPFCICISRDGRKMAVTNNIANKNTILQTYSIL